MEPLTVIYSIGLSACGIITLGAFSVVTLVTTRAYVEGNFEVVAAGAISAALAARSPEEYAAVGEIARTQIIEARNEYQQAARGAAGAGPETDWAVWLVALMQEPEGGSELLHHILRRRGQLHEQALASLVSVLSDDSSTLLQLYRRCTWRL